MEWKVVAIVWIIDIVAWAILFLIRKDYLFPWDEAVFFVFLCIATLIIFTSTILKIIGVE